MSKPFSREDAKGIAAMARLAGHQNLDSAEAALGILARFNTHVEAFFAAQESPAAPVAAAAIVEDVPPPKVSA